MERPFLTPKELADLGRVHIKTVYRWIRSGKVAAFKPDNSAKGIWMIPRCRLRLDMLPNGFADWK